MTLFQFLTLTLCTLCFGLIIGAYFGTIEYRIRMDLPLITKDCFCPDCGHRLTLFQQLPVLAWFILGGKCHYCAKPISFRYPAFEFFFGMFYCLSFLALNKNPLFLMLLWFCFITVLLLVRGFGHARSLLKGLGIMYLYHVLYGLLICILCS